MDQITANWISAGVRLIIALFIFGVYLKNRYKFALYFSAFFMLFGIQNIFRAINYSTGDIGWFFLHRLALTGGTVMILVALSHTNIRWIHKYHLHWIAGIFAIISSVVEIYAQSIAGNIHPFWAAIPTLSIGAFGLFVASYYSHSLVKDGWVTRYLLVLGFVLNGFNMIAAIWLVHYGYGVITYYAGLGATIMIGIGWLIDYLEENRK